MKYYLFFFLFVCLSVCGQIPTQPQKAAVKDSYFLNSTTPPSEEKIKHIHSDFFSKDPNKYDGNVFFKGNVVFTHQGSTLTADEVIFYEEQNFAKAIGNVKLTNADGSVITAHEMEYDGASQRGIARTNVVLTDPKQTIRTETLYYDKLANNAYFNTGGTITTDGSTIFTKSANYNVTTRIIDLSGNVKIDSRDYILEGPNVIQNQNTNTATITGPTTIINKANPGNRVYTESGTYNQNTKEVYLNKNSIIYYNGKQLTGDKLYYNQRTGFGTGTGNVTLWDPREQRYIKGGYGEIFEFKDSAMITQKPYAVKILSKDSMYFAAERIIAYQKIIDSTNIKKSFLRAYRKARFFKTNAQGRGDSLSFNETDGIMHFMVNPILWSGPRQVSGDKVEAYFDTENEAIDSVKVIGNALAISKADSLNLKDEFNQVKGKVMTVYYKENQAERATVVGNAQAILYADDQNSKTGETERIGIEKTSCGTIEVLMTNNKVHVITCDIGAMSDTFPMSKISKEERFFPDFNWNTKDRLKRWQDIFEDSPNYEEIVYTEDNPYYEKALKEFQEQQAKEEAKKPKRKRK